MTQAHDLATGPDLSTAEDLSGSDLPGARNDFGGQDAAIADAGGSDLGVVDGGASPDGGSGPTLTGLPSCTNTGQTLDDLFTSVAKPRCANSGCHATGMSGLTFTSASQLKSNTVGVHAMQTQSYNRIVAGNVDQSYLVYKLMNQQSKMMGNGGMMPAGPGAMRLTDAELCKFVVWIKEGAK